MKLLEVCTSILIVRQTNIKFSTLSITFPTYVKVSSQRNLMASDNKGERFKTQTSLVEDLPN